MPTCAGRPFVVTDPGPPIMFGDMYNAVTELVTTPFKLTVTPPAMFLLITYVIEAYCLTLVRFPILTKVFGLKEPGHPINMLQPAILHATCNAIIDDRAIRKSVEDGGIGYHGACTTLEGMCQQILDWNREHEGDKPKLSILEGAAATAKALAA